MCGPVRVNFNGLLGQRPSAFPGGGQVKCTRTERGDNDSRRTRAEFHAWRPLERHPFGKTDVAAYAFHRSHKIFNHSIGFRVIDVKAIKLAVADEIDPGMLLRRNNDARGVDQRLLGG
jgi:hypothetical protein